MRDIHLKELVLEEMDDHRGMTVQGRKLINFGSDSFLGLDRHPHVQEALIEATRQWGTHNGASRAFSTVELCHEAERRLARWLGVEDTLIFPSVTLANIGLIPAVVGQGRLAGGRSRCRTTAFSRPPRSPPPTAPCSASLHPCCPEALEDILAHEQYQGCVVAVDGVYSMTGKIPPLAELDEVTRRYGGTLYVDDAHGTGVVGPGGRGAARMVLGALDQVLMVGSLSKAFSCMGAFVTCTPELKPVLKMRSNTFIFGGPVPPPYLAAICAVCDILESPEYRDMLRPAATAHPAADRGPPLAWAWRVLRRRGPHRLRDHRRHRAHAGGRQVALRPRLLRAIGHLPRRPDQRRPAPHPSQRQP